VAREFEKPWKHWEKFADTKKKGGDVQEHAGKEQKLEKGSSLILRRGKARRIVGV